MPAANALTAGLGGQAGQLASLGLLDGLEQLAAGEIDRDTFNRRYGHRGPHEFEISLPRPGEDPAWIDHAVRRTCGIGDELSRAARVRRSTSAARRGPSWSSGIRCKPGSCTTSCVAGPRSLEIESGLVQK